MPESPAIDIKAMSSALHLGKDGIWYSTDQEDISYPSDGNLNCLAIEEGSFWFRHRNACIASVVKSFPPSDDGAIFDIGGGNGFVSYGLSEAGFDVVLVEPGPVGAASGKSRGLANVVCATTDAAEFKPGSLSAVGLFDVIEHIEDDHAFLQSMGGLIKDDGRLYATVPSYQSLFSADDVFAGHFRRYSLPEICRAMESAGFKVEFASYIFRFLPLPILLLRTLPYKLGLSSTEDKAKNSSRDHAAKSGFFSSLLASLLQSEVDNLNRKSAMRFGGSCLVVATKR